MPTEILYDYHSRERIELYYFVDTTVKKETCMARCAHCYLETNDAVRNFKQDLVKATTVVGNLRAQGYKVSPLVSDSFSYGGEYLRSPLFQNPTVTAEQNQCQPGGTPRDKFHVNRLWTSGMPLVKGDYVELLKLAAKLEPVTITLTSHEIEDQTSPFRGIVQPSIVRKAVQNIQRYNREYGQQIKVGLEFTIGKWNCTRDHVRSYVDYCENLGVDIIRMNSFTDIDGGLSQLRMDANDTVAVYKISKKIGSSLEGRLKMSVGEQFGLAGIEEMGFPETVGDCPAGETFFSVVYPNVFACCGLFKLKVGYISVEDKLVLDQDMLARILHAKKDRRYSGCLFSSYAHYGLLTPQQGFGA